MKIKLSTIFFLVGILLLAASLRLIGINWDQGYHLHPDERAIVLAVNNLTFPTTIDSFLSVGSPWNPHFFAYGSLPFYLLRFVGDVAAHFNPDLGNYVSINLVGRVISTLADIITILLVFLMGRKLLNQSVGLLAAFFYAISVLSIQLSHFYAVDTMLTCFTIATLYTLLLFYEKPNFLKALFIGVFFGLAITTKISAFVLVVAIGGSLIADFVLIFLTRPHRPSHWLPHLTPFIKHLLVYGCTIAIVTLLTVIVVEPYLVIDWKEFSDQTQQQSVMTHNAFIFPYTLQYVNKIPYVYELTNIFFYGLGPLQAIIAFVGIVYAIYLACKKHSQRIAEETILLAFFIPYFLVVGHFAVGFMRYMLPIYPLFAVFGAIFLYQFLFVLFKQRTYILTIYYSLLVIVLLIWPLSFIHVYMQANPRVSATDWINTNIPPGATIAIEHWDDSLPLTNQVNYHMITLTLYDPDTQIKWQTIDRELTESDYIIVASNRLSVPLQKLTNCAHLPPDKCYTTTAQYYHNLFSGNNVILNSFQDPQGMPNPPAGGRHDTEVVKFQKVAEFTDYPTIPLLNLPLNDQGADESFTVYDHPKVMIFKRIALSK